MNRLLTLGKLLALTWALLLLSACQHERYLIVVINEADQPIDDVTLWLGDLSFEYLRVPANSRETGIYQQHRLTDEIRITWLDHQGQDQQQRFDTFEFIPRNYDHGRVHLTHQNGRFTLSFDNQPF